MTAMSVTMLAFSTVPVTTFAPQNWHVILIGNLEMKKGTVGSS